MCRSSSPPLVFCLAALCAGLGAGPSHAAPFDVFFAEPMPTRAHRPVKRRNGAAAPRSAPTRQTPQARAATVPLPVPRPQFPGDGPEPAPAPQGEAAATAPAAAAEAPSSVPFPPPRPKDLGATAGAVRTQAPPAQSPAVAATPAPADKAAAQPPPPGKPATAASGATLTVTPRSPADDPSCPGRLKARNVAVEPIAIGPQPDPRCTVVEPVRLTGLSLPDGGTVDFPDKPTIACTTADAFSLYVRDLLAPLGKGTFGSPVAAVWTGPGLECRSRDHIFGAKLSAHGQGLAIDIAQLKLADGRVVAVGEPRTASESGFETAARAGGCGYFHTALGPGSDSYHRTHWHFDLEVRGNQGDGKYCK